MASYLVFPQAVNATNLTSATSQGGLRPLAAVPATGNVGGISIAPSGAPAAAVNDRIDLTADGGLGTATYKYSADGGANYLGRQPVTVWDDGAGGGEGTSATILADTDVCGYSRPVAIDSDGDGVLDKVLVAISRKSNNAVEVYATTDLQAGTGWSKICDAVTVASPDYEATSFNGVQMVAREGGAELFAICTVVIGGQPSLYCYKSSNYGVTWAKTATIDGIIDATNANVDLIVLASGKLLASYLDTDGGNDQIYCVSSTDGITWTSTAKAVTTGATNKTYHAMVQDSNGKTICFYMVSGTGISARQTTKADPASSAATWAAYSETLAAADTSNLAMSACIGAEGKKHLIVADDQASDKLMYSGLLGTGTFSAYDDIMDTSDNLCLPRLGEIGGALWCVIFDSTNNDVELILSQYWETYSAGANEAVTPLAGKAVLGSSGVWYTFSGSTGYTGDYWDIDSAYDYGAERAFLGVPRRPFRSSADNAATFYAVFDAGANSLWSADTVCSWSNLYSLTVDFDSTDTFSPDATVTVSHVCKTIASANLTLAGGQATIANDSLTPHMYRGYRARFATGGTVHLITDNDATHIWCRGQDISGGTGDIQILAPRAWNSLTQANYRYMRINIPQQQTYEDYYSVLLVLGLRTTLASHHIAPGVTTVLPVTDSQTPGGALVRLTRGPMRRSWALNLTKITTAEYNEIAAQVTNQTNAPFAFIKDSANKYDWGLVHAGAGVAWGAQRTIITLDEVV